eukprot:TRINITY_DN395_c0_g2_i1.p1 TRINITY_DN395_c0_g2~~TRINITY_DN395_c0_g2_i1.p1  ORF type:complete len:577 (+),score=82.98 TRINITY_DN395_c0_g2_i1:1782-3512(+)
MAKQDEAFGRITGLIIQGRKLAPKDPNGLSDPFVECGPVDKKGEFLLENKKERKTIKSKVVRKSLAPVWRQAFEIVLDRRTKGFKVQVWDWDYIGASEFMGEIIILLSDMQSGKETEAWYPLKNRPSKPKESVSGEIFIRFTYFRDGSATTGNVTEEERIGLEDARSGDIALVWDALLKHPTSATIQSTGLPNVFKWAATSSVQERVAFLLKHKGKVFEHLSKAATTFPLDPKTVFYSLGSFTFFSKLVEAKPMFSDDHAQLIIKQLQSPPKIFSDDDLSLHISNLLITLANFCTFKFDSQYSAEVVRCQEMMLQKGAISEALNCLKNYEKNEVVRRSALSVLLKAARSNVKVKDSFGKLGVADEMIRICRRSKSVMLKWLAVDVLDTYARGDNRSYCESVLGISGCVKYLNGNFTDAEGPHPASLCTATVYLLEALSASFSDSTRAEIAEEKNMITGIVNSFISYRKSIPKQNQRPLLAERILDLLVNLAANISCRTQIVENFDVVVEIIMKNSKTASVQKSAAALLDLLGSGSLASTDLALKKFKSSSLLQWISSLDKETAKLYDKVKDKLKSL